MVSTISRSPLRNGVLAKSPAHILENATQATPLPPGDHPPHPGQCPAHSYIHSGWELQRSGMLKVAQPRNSAVQRLGHRTHLHGLALHITAAHTTSPGTFCIMSDMVSGLSSAYQKCEHCALPVCLQKCDQFCLHSVHHPQKCGHCSSVDLKNANHCLAHNKMLDTLHSPKMRTVPCGVSYILECTSTKMRRHTENVNTTPDTQTG